MIIEDLKPRLIGSLMYLLSTAAGFLLILMQIAIVLLVGWGIYTLFIR